MRAWRLAALLTLALAGCGNNDDVPAAPTTTAWPTTVPMSVVEEATAIAQASMPIELIDEIVADMIDELCQAAKTGERIALVYEVAALPVADGNELRVALDALEAGALRYCPEVLADAPETVDTLYAEALAAPSPEDADESTPATLNPPMTTIPPP